MSVKFGPQGVCEGVRGYVTKFYTMYMAVILLQIVMVSPGTNLVNKSGVRVQNQ